MQAISTLHASPLRAGSAQQRNAEDAARSSWIFRALVQAFLLADRSPAVAQVDSATLLSGPMPLHTELKVARARQLGTTGLTGSQPVTDQTRQVDGAKGGRFELRQPDIHSDGTVTYSVTHLNEAHRIEELNAHPQLAQGLTIGQVPVMPIAPVELPQESFLRHWFFEQDDQTEEANQAAA